MALPNNNDVIYGTDLVLLVDVSAAGDGTEYQQVAHATSHSIDTTRESRTVSSKSTGEVNQARYGKFSWSGSLDGLLIYDSAVFNYEKLLDLQMNRGMIKIVSVMNDFEIGTPLEDTVVDYDPADTTLLTRNPFKTGTPYYSGDAIITSLGKTAGEGENATFSMSFEGASDFEKKTVAAIA